MYTVAELMTRELITLDENDDVGDANKLLAKRHIRHLPVVRDGKLIGLITHRDLLRCAAARTGERCRARDVMATPVRTARPDTSVREAIQLMRSQKFGCLPVVRETGELCGIITESDLVRFAEKVIEEMDREQLAREYGA